MQTTVSLINGIFVLLSLILLAVILKKVNVLQKEHSLLFSRLVLKVTLPALIFSSLVTTQFNTDYMLMALIMALVEIGCIFLAWSFGTLLRFKRDVKGALVLASAFGMSTMLGYPLISELFPGNTVAMEEAVITSEFGVGFLLFIFGPLIAMYYGQSGIAKKDLLKSAGSFFISPIFISLVAGISLSFVQLDQNNRVFVTINHFCSLIGNANVLLAALAVGLMIEIKSAGKYYAFIIIAVFLKLIIKPLLAFWCIKSPQFTDMMREIILIETAMPSAIVGAVFAKHYNCKPELVSAAVMITLILSVLTISLLFILLF